MEKLELEKETGYKIGDFKIILEENGELRVIVETHKYHLQIKPSSGNAVILIPTKY